MSVRLSLDVAAGNANVPKNILVSIAKFVAKVESRGRNRLQSFFADWVLWLVVFLYSRLLV